MIKYILFVALIITVFSCGSDKQVEEVLEHPKQLVSQKQDEGVDNDFIRTYEGSIGGQYEIMMRIIVNSGKIEGKYFYKKKGVNIDVTGNLQSDGAVTLKEFDAKGNQTGVFTGRMINKSKIEGNWSKPNGNGRKDFLLIESNVNYEESISIAAKNKSLKLGKHKFGVQFIDGYGYAAVSEKGGSLYISGEQFSKEETEYVSIDGKINVITDRKFTVEGEIDILVENCCGVVRKSGVFTFLRSGERKYWRLQERDLFCDQGICAYYIDIFQL